jgi:hypothetical protein
MTQQTYNRSAQILHSFTEASTNDLITLYEPGIVNEYDLTNTTRYYGFITDLRVKIDINSIPEIALPSFPLDASRTDKMAALQDLEWNSARKQLDLFIETSTQLPTLFASVSLLNRLPYYHVNLLPYFTDNGVINIANNTRLLGRITDVSWGLLLGDDNVIVFGSAREECTTLPTEARIIQYSQPHEWSVENDSIIILSANSSRLQATFVNRHATSKIYLNYGVTAELGKGICLLPNGGTYEINTTNPYHGVISAISESVTGASLSGIECM